MYIWMTKVNPFSLFLLWLSSHLEDFDLTAGRMLMLCILFAIILFESVNLNAKRHALFSPMLPHGELCADAVNLKQGIVMTIWKLVYVVLFNKGERELYFFETHLFPFHSDSLGLMLDDKLWPTLWKQLCGCVYHATWIKTEVLFDGSHRNSTVLSWVGLALGSTMPTDMGISAMEQHKTSYQKDCVSKLTTCYAACCQSSFHSVKIQLCVI